MVSGKQSAFPEMAVVILAGGQSSRMRSDKALLKHRLAGLSLLDRMLNIARELLTLIDQDAGEVFVSGSYAGYRCIADIFPDLGPLSGIHAALDMALKTAAKDEPARYLLFLPVDMPELRAATLARLIECGQRSRTAHFEGFEFPALLKVESATENFLRERLSASVLSRAGSPLHEFMAEIHALKISASPGELKEFVNLNTRGDFEEWSAEKQV